MEQESAGTVVYSCGTCGVRVSQRNLRYVADRTEMCPCDHAAMRGEDDVFGQPSVCREAEWCGCGEPDAVDRLMLAYLRSRAGNTWPKEPPCTVSEDAGLLLAYLADALGWCEHGSIVTSGWLTESGKEALANLERLVSSRSSPTE